MEKIDGGVTAAKGFLAAHTAAGIKYQGRDDMAMIYSKVPAVAAGTYPQCGKGCTGQMGSAGGRGESFRSGGSHECRDRQCLYRTGRHGLL